MVHLVMECTQLETVFVFDQQPFKSRMGRCSGQGVVLHVKQDVHRVRRHDPVDHDTAQEDHMFDRMHREARPRTNIDVSVMKRMHMFVQERDVQEPVDPIELKALPDRDQQEQCYEPDRICSPVKDRRVAVRHGPEH